MLWAGDFRGVAMIGGEPRVNRKPANVPQRIAKIASAVSILREERDVHWVLKQVATLAEKLETKKLSASHCVVATKSLRMLGYLDTDEGKLFVAGLKFSAMADPSELDDFETLAEVVKILPRGTFKRSELKDIREAYSNFAEEFAGNCGFSDPETIREEASRVETVGDSLGVDTSSAQESLRETADEIEKEQEEGHGEDSDRHSGVS